MQVKFWGGDDHHGFRIFNTYGNTVPFKVDGTGNVTADKYTANTIIQNGRDLLTYTQAAFDKANTISGGIDGFPVVDLGLIIEALTSYVDMGSL